MAWGLSDIFLSTADREAGARADATLEELNRRAWEAGKISTAEYNRRQTASMEQSAGTYNQQIDDAFRAGWREGETNVSEAATRIVSAVGGAASSVVGAPIAGALKGVPLWAWILGGLALNHYLGGTPRLVAGLKNAFK